MPNTLPAQIKKLPKANIPLSGGAAYISQGENHQILFMEFKEVVLVPEHSHGAQWGVVLSGKIELTVTGELNIYAKGDQYYIPDGVIHSAKIFTGYSDISFFDEKDRYKIMA